MAGELTVRLLPPRAYTSVYVGVALTTHTSTVVDDKLHVIVLRERRQLIHQTEWDLELVKDVRQV